MPRIASNSVIPTVVVVFGGITRKIHEDDGGDQRHRGYQPDCANERRGQCWIPNCVWYLPRVSISAHGFSVKPIQAGCAGHWRWRIVDLAEVLRFYSQRHDSFSFLDKPA